jgi:type II secretory pathway pseudopilin PulG
MKDKRNNKKGFSLTEILMAVGTLAIGMLFIAGVFPAGILFSTQATERTIAAIVADEAFAMVKITAADPHAPVYSWHFAPDRMRSFERVANTQRWASADESRHYDLPEEDFAYPATDELDMTERRYVWSAMCRRTGLDDDSPVQVTVFVCRRGAPGAEYWGRHPDPNDALSRLSMPRPVYVQVVQGGALTANQVEIQDVDLARSDDEVTFVNDGSIIVDGVDGQLYRVLRRDDAGVLTLERNWERDPSDPSGLFWVLPPAAGGGRYPCIAVFQKVIKF